MVIEDKDFYLTLSIDDLFKTLLTNITYNLPSIISHHSISIAIDTISTQINTHA